MSDKESEIRKFFNEKADILDGKKYLQGKVPIDLLGVVRFEDGECHTIYPKDKVIRAGLMEHLKTVITGLRE